jgi:hypothetical protein
MERTPSGEHINRIDSARLNAGTAEPGRSCHSEFEAPEIGKTNE